MAAVAVPEERAAHREAVRDLLARLLKNHSLAEDLVQEALIHATRVAKGYVRRIGTANLAHCHRVQSHRLMLLEPMITFGPLAELCDHGPSSRSLRSSHKRPCSAVYGWVFSIEEVIAAMTGR